MVVLPAFIEIQNTVQGVPARCRRYLKSRDGIHIFNLADVLAEKMEHLHA